MAVEQADEQKVFAYIACLVLPVIAIIAAWDAFWAASAFSVRDRWIIGSIGAVLAGVGATLFMDVLLGTVVVPVLDLIVKSRRVR